MNEGKNNDEKIAIALCDSLANAKSEQFDAVVLKYGVTSVKNVIHKKITSGKHQGTSVFFSAIAACGKNKHYAWNFIVKHLSPSIEDFRVKNESKTMNGATGLWVAICDFCCSNSSIAWNYIEQHFSKLLTIDDFRVSPKDYATNGICYAVSRSGNDRTKKILIFIIENFSDQLSIEDFRIESTSGRPLTNIYIDIENPYFKIAWDFIKDNFSEHLVIEDFFTEKDGRHEWIMYFPPNLDSRRKKLSDFIDRHCFFVYDEAVSRITDINQQILYKKKLNFIEVLSAVVNQKPKLVLKSNLRRYECLQENTVYLDLKRSDKNEEVLEYTFLSNRGKKIVGSYHHAVGELNEQFLINNHDAILSAVLSSGEFALSSTQSKKLIDAANDAADAGFVEAHYMAAMSGIGTFDPSLKIDLLLQVRRESLHYQKANELGYAEALSLMLTNKSKYNDWLFIEKALRFVVRKKDNDYKDLFRFYYSIQTGIPRSEMVTFFNDNPIDAEIDRFSFDTLNVNENELVIHIRRIFDAIISAHHIGLQSVIEKNNTLLPMYKRHATQPPMEVKKEVKRRKRA